MVILWGRDVSEGSSWVFTSLMGIHFFRESTKVQVEHLGSLCLPWVINKIK